MSRAVATSPAAEGEPMPDLPGSQEITASSGSNLALAFTCLTPEKGRAMSIYYAFCRVIDDVADSTEISLTEKRRQLGEWREEIRRAYHGTPRTPLGREMAEVIETYHVPPEPIEELFLGVEADLVELRQPDFASLARYCYRVASAVGLVSIEIFGYKEKITREYAVALGMAFQLTNILRDVKKDASFGRIYLPLDEMAHFGVTEEEIMESRWSPRMRKLCLFQYHRAAHYFEKSWRLLSAVDRPNLQAAEIMREVYQGILVKIRRHDYNVFDREARLNKAQKALAILRARKREKKVDPAPPPPPKSVLVLGGGFAGIATALDLSRRGHKVTLAETRNGLGGRAHSFRDAKSGVVLDNGQHVLMGCYHRTLHWMHELGVDERLWQPPTLDVPYRSERGASVLRAPHLPGSLGLLGAMIGFDELSWPDRLAAMYLSARLRLGQRPAAEETAAVWLRRWSQTDNAVRAVWEPLCLAALNEPLATASAELLATVIRRSLLGSARDAQIIISKVGLTDLYADEFQQFVTMGEGTLRLQTQISGLKFEGNRCVGATTSQGETLTADHYVSALPWSALRGLLPEGHALAVSCEAFQNSAIISLHLWLTEPILEEPFVGFLDSPLHWVFNRAAVAEPTADDARVAGHLHSLIISGANDLADLSSDELEKLAMGELRRFLPAARSAQVLHRLVYKARGATFAATPEAQRHRPNTATPWRNFWLAGDWTNTGLPGTIEGAVISGETAGAAVDAA